MKTKDGQAPGRAGHSGDEADNEAITPLSSFHVDCKPIFQRVNLYKWCVRKGRLQDGQEILKQLVDRKRDQL